MPPVIEPRQIPTLSGFKPVSAEEISKIIGASPSKHCMLDPAPTWLIKKLLPDLAETIAKMCNMSLEEGIFPNSVKSTIVPAKIEEDESRSGRHELISTNFELDILVKNSRKSSCDQIRRALWAAQAIASPPICLSFVPFHRDSCFSCPQRFSTNDGQWKH